MTTLLRPLLCLLLGTIRRHGTTGGLRRRRGGFSVCDAEGCHCGVLGRGEVLRGGGGACGLSGLWVVLGLGHWGCGAGSGGGLVGALLAAQAEGYEQAD